MAPTPPVTLHLIKGVPTLDQVIRLSAILTGRPATADEIAKAERILRGAR